MQNIKRLTILFFSLSIVFLFLSVFFINMPAAIEPPYPVYGNAGYFTQFPSQLGNSVGLFDLRLPIGSSGSPYNLSANVNGYVGLPNSNPSHLFSSGFPVGSSGLPYNPLSGISGYNGLSKISISPYWGLGMPLGSSSPAHTSFSGVGGSAVPNISFGYSFGTGVTFGAPGMSYNNYSTSVGYNAFVGSNSDAGLLPVVNVPRSTETRTTEVISKKIAAEDIISTLVNPIWKDAEKSKGLRVLQYDQILPAGARVKPALVAPGNEHSEIVCKNQSWLFFIDEDPSAHFAHPVRIVVLDATTGDQEIIHADWWPTVNDRPVFSKIVEREEPQVTIFYEQPSLNFEIKIQEDLYNYNWVLKDHGPCQVNDACEVWAIIVCGFNDLPDTFDEDTDGMYNVLKNHLIPDDHIFFVSPHTTHAGVDRTTSNANVQWAINQVASQSDVNDKVLFFYSSHGNIDILSCVNDSAITASQLDSWLDNILADELIIIMEACHSGSFIGRYADGTYNIAEDELTGDGETNRAIFTSASTDTSSYGDVDGADDPNPSDSGSETIWGYVEAFAASTSDLNGDSEISFGEAWQYAWNNDVTRIRGDNTPQMIHTGLNINNTYNYCLCPDLIISKLIYSPSNPTTIDEITFTATVKNVGGGTAGASSLSFKVGGETYPPSYSIPSLQPGASYTVQRKVVLGVAQNYLTTVKADANGTISESNEANNTRNVSFTVSSPSSNAPDLVVDTLTYSPSNPTTIDEITFTATVKNIGGGTAGASSLSFKVGGETYPPSYNVPSLQPGAFYTVQRKVVLGVAQNYLATVKADANGTISESNEANNTRKVSFTVSP